MPSAKFGIKIILLFVFVFGCLFLICFREFLNYVLLDVPSPISYLPNGDWSKVLYTTRYFVDEYGKVFMLRKEGLAYGSNNGYLFDAPEHVMEYFNDYLVDDNWVLLSESEFDRCQDELPEKDYVSDLYYREYVKKGDDPLKTNRRVCLAVVAQEWYLDENESTFKVILVSSQYSPLTEFFEAFRNW